MVLLVSGIRSQQLTFVGTEMTGNIGRKLAGSVNTTMSKFTSISQLLSWNSPKGCPKADKGPVVMSWCPFDPGKAAMLTTSGTITSEVFCSTFHLLNCVVIQVILPPHSFLE